jgi:ubiquinone/menaquinone biosynthesis C-methylase UbiE
MDDEEQRVRRVYERYRRSERRARAWSAENPGNRLIREEVAAVVRERAGALGSGAVLDVGCGSGWWLRDLARSGVSANRLHGVDLLPSRLEAAGREVPGAELRQADARALPWPDGRFRLVTLFLVLSSQASQEIQIGSLREALRVLAPGGDLFVWEPRIPNPANPATRLVRRATLRRALGEDITTEPVTLLPALARRLRPSEATYRRLARSRVLCSHRVIHARKPHADSP